MKCLEIHKKMLSSLLICKLKSCLKARHKSKHKWESISTPDLNERDTDTILWRKIFLRYFSIKINLGSIPGMPTIIYLFIFLFWGTKRYRYVHSLHLIRYTKFDDFFWAPYITTILDLALQIQKTKPHGW